METAFLSVRLPVDIRQRLKIVAAERGAALQDLVGDLVERFLAEAERKPPLLAETIRKLRGMESELSSKGVVSLGVFGSVARGEARADSDIDLVIEFEPGVRVSLFDREDLKEAMETVLGYPVDLGERSALMPHAQATAASDIVPVF